MSKVRLTLEVDSEFVSLLTAKARLKNWTRWSPTYDGDALEPEMDVGAVLGWVVAQEAQGGLSEIIDASIPPTWRPHIESIHEERRVYKDGKQISGPELVDRKTNEIPAS